MNYLLKTMMKLLTILSFLLSSLNLFSQIHIRDTFTPPKFTPDTLYFAFNNGIQLIVIDSYDTWNRWVSYKDAIEPRGSSYRFELGPGPRNIYIFRNKEGKIIKVYNANLTNENGLKNTDYINTTSVALHSLEDYSQLNNHLKFYSENDKVGLINLQGEVVLPAIYDEIRKYQDDNDKRDKLIIEKDGMFGLVDAKLNILFPPIYRTGNDKNNYGYPEHNIINKQYLKVYKNGKCGLINENGDSLIAFKFDDIRLIHDTMYVGINYRTEANKNQYFWHRVENCIVYDKQFSQLTELKNYEQIEYNGIKRFIVKKDNKVGVLNHKGEVIVPLEYDHLTPQNGDYYVFKNDKSGMINLEGKIVIPIEFERNMYFYGQAIYVVQDGLIGVYSNTYKLIAKPKFKFKTWDMGKYVLTREDGSKGFVMHQKEGSYYQSPEGEIIKF